MDKQPCEHEINDNENVTVADIHSEDDQVSKDQSSSQEVKPDDDDPGNTDCSSNLTSETHKHSQPTEQSEQESENIATEEVEVAAPKVALLRSNVSFNAKSLSLPKVNCKEKIILCIDNSVPMFSSSFKRTIQSIKQTSVFNLLIGSLRQFIMTKTFINKKHEYSLITLNEDAQLITRFTDQGTEVLYRLQEIANDSQLNAEESNGETKDFDLSGLFDLIANHVELPPDQPPQNSPPFTVRVILVYGRSERDLEFKAGKEAYEKLSRNPYFFIDCLYIHDEPAEANNVTDIFSCLCELDTTGLSYVLEVSVDGSMSALYNAFAKLCCHPLQRQRQCTNPSFEFLAD